MRFHVRIFLLAILVWAPLRTFAQTPDAAADASATAGPDPVTTAAAAAVASGRAEPAAPDFVEHLVDEVLALFNVRSSGNSTTHFVIAALFLFGAVVLRRVVTRVLFGFLRKLAARTKTTLDDKLFVALEAPVGALIVLIGALMAVKVLKLSTTSDQAIRYGSTIAFSLVVFWLLLRAFNTVLQHLQDVAASRQMGIAAFMPWIRKTLLAVFVVFGVLLVAQSLGADVKAFLAGLGIGGLAMALAAQDTIANLFGSVVVAIDQPFKIGETVKIGSHTGQVEDIGLRSTKLRLVDKSLTIVPNKTVAAEAVNNLSRFTQRRVEQVIGLTYQATAEDMEGIVADLRALILAEEEVDAGSVHVYFRDFSASSLDIWIVYLTKDPDFARHMKLRQRLNNAFMRAIARRGLSFAFPSQSIYLEGDAARLLSSAKDEPAPGPASPEGGRASAG